MRNLNLSPKRTAVLGLAILILAAAGAYWLFLGIGSAHNRLLKAALGSNSDAVAAPNAIDSIEPAAERAGAHRAHLEGEEALGILRVRTLDAATGRPLEGCDVALFTEEAERRLGVSDRTGWLETEATKWVPGSALHASRAHYADEQVLLPPEENVVTIRMASGFRLTGTVVDIDGEPLGSGLRVVAWPPSQAPRSGAALGRLLAGRGAGTATRTEEGGNFVLSGLAPARRYALVAFGNDRVSAHPFLYEPTARRDSIEVIANEVLAARVLIREADSSVPRTSSPRRPPLAYGRPASLVPIERGDPRRLLILPREGESVDGPFDWTGLFLVDSGWAGPAMLHVSAICPGYEVAASSVALAPPGEGGLSPTRLVVQRKAEAWGHLRVEWDQDAAFLRLGLRPPAARLLLASLDLPGEEWWFDLRPPPEESELELGAGRYAASLFLYGTGAASGLPLLRTSVELSGDGPTLLSLRELSVGLIRLHLLRAADQEHLGKSWFEVRAGPEFRPGLARHLRFDFGPFELYASPGDYGFLAYAPYSSGEEPSYATVIADSVTEHALFLQGWGR